MGSTFVPLLMSKNISIQLKATFLLAVFSLNSLLGFACSVGINMGYNKHHHDKEMMPVHGSDHHSDADHQNSGSGKDDCCKGTVTEFNQMVKSVPQAYTAGVDVLFFTSFVSVYYQVNIFSTHTQNIPVRYFVRRPPPTIPDIRIAIQSFLI